MAFQEWFGDTMMGRGLGNLGKNLGDLDLIEALKGTPEYDFSKVIETDNAARPFGFLLGDRGESFSANVSPEDITRNIETERDRELGEDLEKTGDLFKELSKYGDPGVEGNVVKPILTGTPPPAKIVQPRGMRMVEGPKPRSLLSYGQLEEATRERIAYFLANSGLLGKSGLGQSALTHNTLFGPRSA